MIKTDVSPAGHVKIDRQGDVIRIGSRIERVTRTGERVLEGFDFGQTCSWINQFRGDPRYSGAGCNGGNSAQKREGEVSSEIKGRYVLMGVEATYALGADALKEGCKEDEDSPHPQFILEDGSKIYRPLTFGENLAARLQDSSLFNYWSSTCTGIAYQKNSTKFKIIPMCRELITIPKDFAEWYLNANYNKLNEEEFDRNKVKHNTLQSREDAKKDPLWLAAAGSKDLLSDYVDEVFDRLGYLGKGKGMAFNIRKDTLADELRAVYVDYIDYNPNVNSNAIGTLNLNIIGCFLRVAPI